MLTLRPSAAHRWMRCPASPRLSLGLPDDPGEAAKDGTAAHLLAEWCLKNGEFSADEYLGFTEAGRVSDRPFTADMIESVNAYLEHVYSVLKPEDVLLVEQKVEIFRDETAGVLVEGTPDCSIYSERTKTLRIPDMKTGLKYVEAVQNPQLLCYALGSSYDPDTAATGVDVVEITVVQPACYSAEPVRTWTLSGLELWEFGLDLREAAIATTRPDAPAVPGDHCEYCPAQAAGKCPAREAQVQSVFEEIEPKAELVKLSTDEIGERFTRAKAIESYLNALERLAKDRAKAGAMPKGWKFVSSGSTRVWAQTDAATVGMVRERIGVDISNPSALSPAQAEKMIGPDRFALLADLIEKKPKSPQLAKESDKRPALSPAELRQAGNSFDDV